ncbi:MAG TPA: hypothetical protein VMV86_01430 [Methanosarcinales archaeon]|nr:hypothetical protein [Methanosarcinales archaeon]
MTNPHKIEQLRGRSEKVYSNGKLLDYNLFGDVEQKKYYQHYDRSPYSQVQNFLYKRAIKGLRIFTKEEVDAMHPKKKRRIIKTHRRAQKEIAILKQVAINKSTNKFLELFHHSPLAQDIIKSTFLAPKVKNEFSPEDLGITKDVIIERLHEIGILPKTFYEIK